MRKHFLLDLSKLLVCFTAAFLLASCRDVTNGAVTGSSYGERLTVNLTAQAEDGLGNIVDLSNSSSRSILPSTFDARDLAFRISGFSRKGKFVGTSAEDEVAIEFESHEFTSGTTKPAAAQELTFDIWELTLTAYKTDDTEYQRPVLRGRTIADLSDGGEEIPFIISSRGLETPGSVNLHFRVDDYQDKLNSIKLGLYDKNTGLEVVGKTKNVAKANIDSDGDYRSFDDAIISNVTPGTYLYNIYFYADDVQTKPLGFWSDLIVVDAGNVTTCSNTNNAIVPGSDPATIDLGDILNKVPDAPADLNAYIIDDYNDPDKYHVRLTWEDVSNNEEYFVLTITEYTDLTTKGAVYFTNEDLSAASFAGWEGRLSGSLLSGNETVDIILPTGRLFDITLAAKNNIGISDEAVRVDNGEAISGLTLYSAQDNNRINRVALTHYLNRGTLTLDGVVQTGDKYIDYQVYEGSNISVLDIDGTTNTLVSNGHPFVKWVQKLYANPLVEVTETDWHNIACYADYDQTYYITYEQEGWQEMDASRVTATCPSDCKNTTVDASTEKTIRVTIDGTLGTYTDGRTYDYFEFRINGQSYQAGAGNTFDISTTELESGVYIFNALARSGTQWYCNTFSVTIER